MGVNLLPWRQKQYYENLRRFIFILIVCLLFEGGLIIITSDLYQNEQHILQNNNERYQSILQDIQQVKEKISLLRKDHRYQDEEYVLENTEIKNFLSFLHSLPLEQGELTSINLTKRNLILKGEVISQEEFIALQKTLMNSNLFKYSKLTKFEPKGTRIFFEFNFNNNGYE